MFAGLESGLSRVIHCGVVIYRLFHRQALRTLVDPHQNGRFESHLENHLLILYQAISYSSLLSSVFGTVLALSADVPDRDRVTVVQGDIRDRSRVARVDATLIVSNTVDIHLRLYHLFDPSTKRTEVTRMSTEQLVESFPGLDLEKVILFEEDQIWIYAIRPATDGVTAAVADSVKR